MENILISFLIVLSFAAMVDFLTFALKRAPKAIIFPVWFWYVAVIVDTILLNHFFTF